MMRLVLLPSWGQRKVYGEKQCCEIKIQGNAIQWQHSRDRIDDTEQVSSWVYIKSNAGGSSFIHEIQQF